jgi:hypothetical protein
MEPKYELKPLGNYCYSEHYDRSRIFKQFKTDKGFSVIHCLNGPAIEMSDGTKEWWIDGKQYTEEEFNRYLKNKAFW